MASFGQHLVVVPKQWSAFKEVLAKKSMTLQYDESSESYQIFSIDNPIAYECIIFKGSVPDGMKTAYTQQQNDTDKAEFEASYKPKANSPIIPRASDGKQFIITNMFPGEVLLNFAGCSDQGTTRYAAPLFELSKNGVGDVSMDFAFCDGIFVAGGAIQWVGGGPGSWIDMCLHSVQSSTTPASPGGTGNCNLSPTGVPGLNIIVPAAGNGAYNISSPVPIPANDEETHEPNGYWEYSDPWIGKGTMSAGVPGKSKWNLFDQPLKLAMLAKMPLLTPSGFRTAVLQQIKPKWVLPSWFFRVTIHNAAANATLYASWDLTIARRKST